MYFFNLFSNLFFYPKYSEAIIRNLDFLLAKLEEKISGVTSPKEVFDTLLDVLANNDIN